MSVHRRLLLCLAAACLAVATDTAPVDRNEIRHHLYACNYDRAAALCRQELERDPHWAQGHDWLVRALFGAKRPEEAYRAAESAAARAPGTAEARTSEARALFRRGQVAKAELAYLDAMKLNPKYAPAVFGLATVRGSISHFETARRLIERAYALDPEDPANMLALAAERKDPKQRLAELEKLATVFAPDSDEMRWLQVRLAAGRAVGAREFGVLRTPYQPYSFKLDWAMVGPLRHGIMLTVRLNDRYDVRLLVDTGASGILVRRKAAERAGLEALETKGIETRAIGDESPRRIFRHLASEVRIGDFVLANYPVDMLDANFVADQDGLIGTDVFEQFRITLDVPGATLSLDPYPGLTEAPERRTGDAARQLAPGFFPFFRVGHAILLPTAVERLAPKLFLVDTGSSSNLISTGTARECGGIGSDYRRIKGVQGNVREVFSVGKVHLGFANLRQSPPEMLSIDFGEQSDRLGTEMSGILGMPALGPLKTVIDYRNGAISFTYTPHVERGW